MGTLIYSILLVKVSKEKIDTLLSEMKGLEGENIYGICIDEIIAVVSEINNENISKDKFTAIEYAGIIEILSQQFTLLPMRYGSVMESSDSIIKMLRRNYPEILQNLLIVENKFEYGLKILCDSDKLKSDLRDKSQTQTQLSDNQNPDRQNSVYRDWVNKKLIEHRLEELVLTYVDSIISQITETLDGLNTIHKFKKMASESIMVDSVFLLGKEFKNDLITKIESFQNLYPELNFVLTGPWPPYSFVNFTVK